MANRVTSEDILRMNEIYYKTHVFAEVARQTGFSASTVRKHVDVNWKPVVSENVKRLYNILTYFDTILLSVFDKVIGFDSEYEDDGYIYAHKYVYLGPGANMRKGHQDNRTEGYAVKSYRALR